MFVSGVFFDSVKRAIEANKSNVTLCKTPKDPSKGLTSNNARDGKDVVVGDAVSTKEGHTKKLFWTGPDGESKNGTCLVNYAKKTALLIFSGTPVFSNYTSCRNPIRFVEEKTGKTLEEYDCGTPEGAFKMGMLGYLDGYPGVDKALMALINAKDVRDQTMCTQHVEKYPGSYCDSVRTFAMERALKGKFKQSENIAAFWDLVDKCLTKANGELPFDVAECDFKFFEANYYDPNWGVKITPETQVKQVKKKVEGKDVAVLDEDGNPVKETIKGFNDIFEELKYEIGPCREAMKKLGKNMLGELMTECFAEIQTKGIAKFVEDNSGCNIIYVSDKRSTDDIGAFFESDIAPPGVDQERFEMDRINYKKLFLFGA